MSNNNGNGVTTPIAELTTAEHYARLEEEGLETGAILKAIYQNNINADTKELCQLSGLTSLQVGRVKGVEVSRTNRARRKLEAARLAEENAGRGEGRRGDGRSGPPTTSREGVFYTAPDPIKILTDVLTHPDIKPGHVTEILDWANRQSGALHPAQLYNLLVSFKGVDKNTASMTSQKYTMALQKAFSEARTVPQIAGGGMGMPMGAGITPQTGYIPPNQFQQPFQQFPSVPFMGMQGQGQRQGIPQGYMSHQEVTRLLENQRRGDTLATVVSTLASLQKDLPNQIKEAVGSLQPQQGVQEIIEYLDANGNVVTQSEGVSTRITRSTVQGSGELSALRRDFQNLQRTVSTKQIEGLEKKVEDLGKTKEEPQYIKDMKAELATANKKFDEFKDQMTADQKKQLEDKVTDLGTKLDEYKRAIAAGGVNSPEAVIATAIQTVGARKPMDKVVELAGTLLGPGGNVTTQPPDNQLGGPEQRGSVITGLRKEGLVRTFVERRKQQ